MPNSQFDDDEEEDVKPLEPVSPGRSIIPTPRPPKQPPAPPVGSTGGLLPVQGLLGGESPKAEAVTYSDDREERRAQVRDQVNRRDREEWDRTHPFTPSSEYRGVTNLSGRVAMEQADTEVATRRQQEIADRKAAREQEILAQKTRNAEREAQFRGTGQKFYRDEFGDMQPVVDPKTKRPLYSPTEWAPGMDTAGRPSLVKRDQFGQTQYKRHPIVSSPDPKDGYLYADTGDGQSLPYMTIEEGMQHPDMSLRRTALAASTRRNTALRREALEPLKAELSAAETDIASVRLEKDTIEAQIAKLAPAAKDPAVAQQINDLNMRAAEIEDGLRGGSPLLARRGAARLQLNVAAATSKRDSFIDNEHEILARLEHDGVKDPMSDPTFVANRQALLASAQAVKNANAQLDKYRSVMGMPQAESPAKQEEGPGMLAQTGSLLMRGALAEGYYAGLQGLASAAGFEKIAKYIGEAREGVRDFFEVDDKYARSFGGQVVNALGQAAGTLPGYAIPGVGPVTTLAQIYQGGYDDAKQSGASDETARKAGFANMPAGALDVLADKFIVGKIFKAAKGKMTVGQMLKHVSESMLSEGVTEGLQQLWTNYVAKELMAYDPNRKIDDQVVDSALIGAIVGGAATGVGQAGGAAMRRSNENAQAKAKPGPDEGPGPAGKTGDDTRVPPGFTVDASKRGPITVADIEPAPPTAPGAARESATVFEPGLVGDVAVPPGNETERTYRDPDTGQMVTEKIPGAKPAEGGYAAGLPPADPGRAAEAAGTFVREERDASTSEQGVQALVDELQAATGRPREEILATRKGKETAQWAEELQKEIDYRKGPAWLDLDNRIKRLREDLAAADAEWQTGLASRAQATESAQVREETGKLAAADAVGKQERADKTRARAEVLDRGMTEAERLRQSPRGGEALAGDLAERQAAPPEDPLASNERLKARRDAIAAELDRAEQIRQSPRGGELLAEELRQEQANPPPQEPPAAGPASPATPPPPAPATPPQNLGGFGSEAGKQPTAAAPAPSPQKAPENMGTPPAGQPPAAPPVAPGNPLPTPAAPPPAPGKSLTKSTPDLVSEMIGVAKKSASEFRKRVSNVKLAPVEGGKNMISFEIDGKPFKGELKGRNKDLVVGTSAAADQAIATRVFIDGDASPVNEAPGAAPAAPAAKPTKPSTFDMSRKEMIEELKGYGITETRTGGYVKNSNAGDLRAMLEQARKNEVAPKTEPTVKRPSSDRVSTVSAPTAPTAPTPPPTTPPAPPATPAPTAKKPVGDEPSFHDMVAMSPKEMFDFYQAKTAAGSQNGMTEDAKRIGAEMAKKPGGIQELAQLRDEALAAIKEAVRTKNPDMHHFAVPNQFWAEAYQKATQTGGFAPEMEAKRDAAVKAAKAEAPIDEATKDSTYYDLITGKIESKSLFAQMEADKIRFDGLTPEQRRRVNRELNMGMMEGESFPHKATPAAFDSAIKAVLENDAAAAAKKAAATPKPLTLAEAEQEFTRAKNKFHDAGKWADAKTGDQRRRWQTAKQAMMKAEAVYNELKAKEPPSEPDAPPPPAAPATPNSELPKPTIAELKNVITALEIQRRREAAKPRRTISDQQRQIAINNDFVKRIDAAKAQLKALEQAAAAAPKPKAEVKRADDFETTGNYDVTFAGKTYKIFRDPEDKWWYIDGPGHHHTRVLSTGTQQSAIEAIETSHEDIDRHFAAERAKMQQAKAPEPAAPVAPKDPEVAPAPVETPKGQEVNPTAAQERNVAKLADKAQLKVQKNYLADAVSKAIETAPNELRVSEQGKRELAALPKEKEITGEDPGGIKAFSERERVKRELEQALKKYDGFTITFSEQGSKRNRDWKPDPRQTLEMLIRSKHAEHVTINVPGDGTFRIPNTKEALMAFQQNSLEDFGKGLAPHPVERTMSTQPSSIPKLERHVTKSGVTEAASAFATEDETRHVLMHTVKHLAYTVATDGRTMFVGLNGGGTPLSNETLTGMISKTDKGKPAEGQFPNYRQVFPEYVKLDGESITVGKPREKVSIDKTIDTAETLRLLKLASLATGEKSMSVKLYDIPSGIGFSSQSPDFGSYETDGVNPNAPALAMDPNYLEKSLAAARKLGAEKVRIIVPKDHGPIVVTDGKTFVTVTMPVRLSALTEGRVDPKGDALARLSDAVDSIVTGKGTGVSEDVAQEAVGQWREQNPNAPEVRVVNDPDWTENGLGVRGQYVDGELVINAAYNDNPAEVTAVANHEWAHSTLATPQGRVALATFASRELPPADLARLNQKYPRQLGESVADHRLRLVEEWVAKNAEQAPGVWRRIVESVRGWLAKRGLVTLTNEEAARAMLRALQDAPAGSTSAGARSSLAPQVSSPAFKAWFGESQVVDEQGKPLVVYHGTPKEFNVFDPSKASYSKWNGFGSWFSNDAAYSGKFSGTFDKDGNPAKGETHEVYLSIKEPAIYQGDGPENGFGRLMADFTEITGAKTYNATPADTAKFKNHLKMLGFDGIIVKGFTGDSGLSNGKPVDLYVSLDPEQIKSATNNSGTFDPKNPDIRSALGKRVRFTRSIDALTQLAQDHEQFKTWYSDFQAFLSDYLGKHKDYAPLISDLLAATSPQTSIEENIPRAIRALREYIDTGAFLSFKFAAHQGNLARSVAGEPLSGMKVPDYSNALAGDHSAMAVDLHVAEIMFGVTKPSPRQVQAAKRRIQGIAERLGWTPRETQAALWAANQTLRNEIPQSYEAHLAKYRREILGILTADRRGEGRGAEAAKRIVERISQGRGVAGGDRGLRAIPRSSLREGPEVRESLVTQSLNARGVPAGRLEYEVRNQKERQAEAAAILAKDGVAGAEEKLTDPKIPGDTRVALGGELISNRMAAMQGAPDAKIETLTRDIQRMVAKMQPDLATKAGQSISMWGGIYKDISTGTAIEYIRKSQKKRLKEIGGVEAENVIDDVRRLLNEAAQSNEQSARRTIDALRRRHDSKPAKEILGAFERQMKNVMELKEAGALEQEDLIDLVGKDLGIEGPSASKLKDLSDLTDRIKNAPDHATRSRLELELADRLAIMQGAEPMDLLSSILTANVLSGYTTQGANLVGTALNTIAQLGTVALTNPGRIKTMVEGAISGLDLGIHEAGSIWKTGRSTSDFQDKTGGGGSVLNTVDFSRDFNAPTAIGKPLTKTARALEHVFRFMKAADAVFYYPAREAYARVVATKLLEGQYSGAELAQKVKETLHVTPEAFAAAKKQAQAEGYEGVDLGRRIADITEEARRQSDVGAAAAARSELFGAQTTFTNEPTGLAGVAYHAMKYAVDNMRLGGVPILKPWAMFLKTPANVFNTITNYTPIGLKRAAFGTRGPQAFGGDRIHFNADERARLIVQSSIGTALMTALLVKVAGGDDDKFEITAKGPDDYGKRQQLRQSGWSPYTVRIGNTRISYKDSPLLLPLAIVGHAADAVKYQKSKSDMVLGSKVIDAISQAPQVIFETSMLTGLADLMGAASGAKSGNAVMRTLGSIPANLLIPFGRLLQQIDQTFDNKTYDVSPAVRPIAGVRRMGEEVTDVQGRPVTYNPLSRFGTTEKRDPLDDLLRSKNVFIPEVGKEQKIGNRIMTDEERETFRRVSGQRIRVRLTSIIPRLQSMSQERAKKEIERVTNEERDRARSMVRRQALVPAGR